MFMQNRLFFSVAHSYVDSMALYVCDSKNTSEQMKFASFP